MILAFKGHVVYRHKKVQNPELPVSWEYYDIKKTVATKIVLASCLKISYGETNRGKEYLNYHNQNCEKYEETKNQVEMVEEEWVSRG